MGSTGPPGTCFYCQRPGRTKALCPKAAAERRKGVESLTADSIRALCVPSVRGLECRPGTTVLGIMISLRRTPLGLVGPAQGAQRAPEEPIPIGGRVAEPLKEPIMQGFT